ncbi:MAG: ribonuclease HII [Sulfurovum sp. AS07-7]|nr:MAG: ribonuclease HII [Sulfurovum sp. AS07-7]
MDEYCGIDEAGRGCFAGDLVVAGVILSKNIEKLTDSKKLSSKVRESLYNEIILNSRYHIVSFTSAKIDEIGLSKCIAFALHEIKEKIKASKYIFDGNSSFGVKGIETMVKADTLLSNVSGASILAKVTHDRAILKLSKEFPLYEFEKNKGYGTQKHLQAIKEHGYTPHHRKSFKIKRSPSLFD